MVVTAEAADVGMELLVEVELLDVVEDDVRVEDDVVVELLEVVELLVVLELLVEVELLDVVEEDVDQRFSRLPPEHRQPDTVPLRRLQRAGLPPAELHLGQELLSKLAAIDAAREAGEAVSPLPASSLHPTAGALAPPRRTRRAPHPKPTLRRRAATGAQAADPGAAQQRGRTPAVRVLPGKGRGARHRQVRAGQPRRPPALPSPRGAPRQPKLAAGEANPTEWGRRTRPSASPPASASVGARP